MSFKEWLLKEGGKGSGTKFTATGLNSGGMMQHGSRFRQLIKPAKPYMPNIKTRIVKS